MGSSVHSNSELHGEFRVSVRGCERAGGASVRSFTGRLLVGQ